MLWCSICVMAAVWMARLNERSLAPSGTLSAAGSVRPTQAASTSMSGERGVAAKASRARATPCRPTWRVARPSLWGIRLVDTSLSWGTRSSCSVMCPV